MKINWRFWCWCFWLNLWWTRRLSWCTCSINGNIFPRGFHFIHFLLHQFNSIWSIRFSSFSLLSLFSLVVVSSSLVSFPFDFIGGERQLISFVIRLNWSTSIKIDFKIRKSFSRWKLMEKKLNVIEVISNKNVFSLSSLRQILTKIAFDRRRRRRNRYFVWRKKREKHRIFWWRWETKRKQTEIDQYDDDHYQFSSGVNPRWKKTKEIRRSLFYSMFLFVDYLEKIKSKDRSGSNIVNDEV